MPFNVSAAPQIRYDAMGARCQVQWKAGGDWGEGEWRMSQR